MFTKGPIKQIKKFYLYENFMVKFIIHGLSCIPKLSNFISSKQVAVEIYRFGCVAGSGLITKFYRFF